MAQIAIIANNNEIVNGDIGLIRKLTKQNNCIISSNAIITKWSNMSAFIAIEVDNNKVVSSSNVTINLFRLKIPAWLLYNFSQFWKQLDYPEC